MGKKRAKEHYDFIKEQYYKEIDNSIANTTIHACESIEARIPQYQNAGVAEYVCGVGDKELREAMLDRINFMLSIAEEHGVQTLILGAWGCGVFEWNPEIVAELFMEIKGKYNIPNIIFAVPGLFEYNYMVFNRAFS